MVYNQPGNVFSDKLPMCSWNISIIFVRMYLHHTVKGDIELVQHFWDYKVDFTTRFKMLRQFGMRER